MMEIMLLALVSAAIYALAGYLKSVEEEPDILKAISTMIVGAVVGLVMAASGIDVTQVGVLEQLGMYAGFVCIIENVLKAIWRRYLK